MSVCLISFSALAKAPWGTKHNQARTPNEYLWLDRWRLQPQGFVYRYTELGPDINIQGMVYQLTKTNFEAVLILRQKNLPVYQQANSFLSCFPLTTKIPTNCTILEEEDFNQEEIQGLDTQCRFKCHDIYHYSSYLSGTSKVHITQTVHGVA